MQEGGLIPGNHHITLKILQPPCLLIGDTRKNFVGLKPSMDVGNTDQSVTEDWNSSMMLKIPENVVNREVHQMFVEWVLVLHRDAEFV